MPRVFVYEHVSAGGWLPGGSAADGSLLREGQAMRDALADDFARLTGVEVVGVNRGHVASLPEGHFVSPSPPWGEGLASAVRVPIAPAFRRLAAQSDWTVVIAPEFDDILLAHCEAVLAVGGRLLGPGPDVVRLAADKHATAEHARAARIDAPRGVAMPAGAVLPAGAALPGGIPLPAVLKPRYGAGSQGVERIDALPVDRRVPWAARLEEFVPGVAASVAILSGPAGHVVLPPCRQHLSDDGRFRYLGGELPLPADQAEPIGDLAERVYRALPAFIGFLGMDVVLPTATSEPSAGPWLIEINPRLTTSYLGLRQAAEQNLAGALLELAAGRRPELTLGRASSWQVEI